MNAITVPYEVCEWEPPKPQKKDWKCGDRDMICVCGCGVAHWFPDEEETRIFMKTSVEEDQVCQICGGRSMYITQCLTLDEGHMLYKRQGIDTYSEACDKGRKHDSLLCGSVEKACAKLDEN